MADRDDDERGVRRPVVLRRRRLAKGAQEREGLEVDPGQADPGFLAGADVAVDQLAVGDHEQDPAHDVALLVDPLAKDVVIEHGLLDRDRKGLLGAEADRVLELLRIVDARDLEDPDADAVVGDPEPHALARKLVFAEERAQRLGKKLRLAQLTADHETVVEVLARDLDELRRPIVDDPGGSELGGADLQPHDPLGALVVALAPEASLRLRLGGLLGLLARRSSARRPRLWRPLACAGTRTRSPSSAASSFPRAPPAAPRPSRQAPA